MAGFTASAEMSFSSTSRRLWPSVETIDEISFRRRFLGDQAEPGLIARTSPLYHDTALLPPAYFHPTVGESKSNPDAAMFLKAAHLFAGTWVEGNRPRHHELWGAGAQSLIRGSTSGQQRIQWRHGSNLPSAPSRCASAISDFAEYLHMPKSSLDKLVQQGKVPGQKIRKHRRFRKYTADQLLSASSGQNCSRGRETYVNPSTG